MSRRNRAEPPAWLRGQTLDDVVATVVYERGFSLMPRNRAMRPTPETLTTLKRTPGISPLALPCERQAGAKRGRSEGGARRGGSRERRSRGESQRAVRGDFAAVMVVMIRAFRPKPEMRTEAVTMRRRRRKGVVGQHPVLTSSPQPSRCLSCRPDAV